MKKSFFLLIIALSLSKITFAQDITGSSDHPIITRYPGSKILFYYQKEYNELQMPTAVINNGEAGNLLSAKGKHTSILYKGPEGRSTLEVFRNYEQAIQSAGGEILFSCEGKYAPKGCDFYKKTYGLKFFSSVYRKRRTASDQYLYSEGGSNDQTFLTAKFDRGNTITYLEIGITGAFLGKGVDIQLEIVETSKMDGQLITAESIKEQLDKYGKIQIYTIFFATNSSTIEEGSNATLTAIADFLQQNPSYHLYVVGHTDDTGKFDHNFELSKKRADAVIESIDSLSTGVKSRLKPIGVGPVCPEGSNENEEGRTSNRRVELVKRLK